MFKNKLLSGASLLALMAAAGCQTQDYVARYDGVTAHAGNQLSVNEAQMVSDPWKSRADNTHLHGNGKRIADAVTQYENGGPDEGDGAIELPGTKN